MKNNNSKEDFIFLLKTLEKRFLDSTLDGEFCFSFPEVFDPKKNKKLNKAQADEFDSHFIEKVHNLVFAEVISDSTKEYLTGTPITLAKDAIMAEIDSTCKKSPFSCFRMIKEEDFVKKGNSCVFSLGNIVDRIINDFCHDAFIMICFPSLFFERLSAKTSFLCRHIHYGTIDRQYREFIEKTPFPQAKMFQKRVQYDWQKEFRIVLPPSDEADKVLVNVGSIRDIAFGGDIEKLRLGYAFSDNIEGLKI